MPSAVAVKTSGGGDPVNLVIGWKKALKPTADDLVYAGQRQRTRILERTARGVDVDEKPFRLYSDRGPYYYNPNGRLSAALRGRISEGQQKGAARRFLTKIATREERGRSGAPRLSRTGRTIRFDSYGDFKHWLGRTTVDLRGPRAPHMLQAITVKTNGDAELVLGIYGEPAERATGHNVGTRRLPQRKFFGASAEDAKRMIRDLYERIKGRLRRGL